jgi:chemotaxis protein histidine kinase CheA
MDGNDQYLIDTIRKYRLEGEQSKEYYDSLTKEELIVESSTTNNKITNSETEKDTKSNGSTPSSTPTNTEDKKKKKSGIEKINEMRKKEREEKKKQKEQKEKDKQKEIEKEKEKENGKDKDPIQEKEKVSKLKQKQDSKGRFLPMNMENNDQNDQEEPIEENENEDDMDPLTTEFEIDDLNEIPENEEQENQNIMDKVNQKLEKIESAQIDIVEKKPVTSRASKVVDDIISKMSPELREYIIEIPKELNTTPEEFKQLTILIKEYLKLVQERIETFKNLKETLEETQCYEIVDTSKWKTYCVTLAKPIILRKNWMAYTEKEHDMYGYTQLYITCPASWKECFKFPDRNLYDYDREENIKIAAAFPTFSLIQPIYSRAAWLIVDSSRYRHDSNYSLCIHLSQLRDIREDIIKWIALQALNQSQELRNKNEENEQMIDTLKLRIDQLKVSNIAKMIENGEIPNYHINRKLSEESMNKPALIAIMIGAVCVSVMAFIAGYSLGGQA